MSNKKAKDQGFTLVEITMGVMFAAFIVLILGMTFVGLLNIYTKGMRLSQVKSASDAISSDISRIATNSSPQLVKILISKTNGGKKDLVNYTDDGDKGGRGQYGRLCMGGITYAWKLAGSNDNTTPSLARYNKEFCDKDSSGQYKDLKASNLTDVLLSPDTPLLSFEPIQGNGRKLKNDGDSVRILTVSVTIGTDNFNSPMYFANSADSSPRSYKPYGADAGGFKCGNKLVSTEGFSEGVNKNCAFVEMKFTAYERGGK